MRKTEITEANHILLTELFAKGVFDLWDQSLSTEHSKLLKFVLGQKILGKICATSGRFRQLIKYETNQYLHALADDPYMHINTSIMVKEGLALVEWIDTIYPLYKGREDQKSHDYITICVRHRAGGGCFTQGKVTQLYLKVRKDFHIGDVHHMIYLSGTFGLYNESRRDPVYPYTVIQWLIYKDNYIQATKSLMDIEDGAVFGIRFRTVEEPQRPTQSVAYVD